MVRNSFLHDLSTCSVHTLMVSIGVGKLSLYSQIVHIYSRSHSLCWDRSAFPLQREGSHRQPTSNEHGGVPIKLYL